jgi:hypothetical protein
MKKYFPRLVLVSLLELSLGAAGAVFAEASMVEPLTPGCDTVSCSGSTGCIGSTCTCHFDGGTQFNCGGPQPLQP